MRDSLVMYVDSMDAVPSAWFTSYEAARQAQEAGGGYLLPFRSQFFVTPAEGIRELGLDPADPDWELIGRDWVRPRDLAAWERLAEKRWMVGT
jgi:hypothetical protein